MLWHFIEKDSQKHSTYGMYCVLLSIWYRYIIFGHIFFCKKWHVLGMIDSRYYMHSLESKVARRFFLLLPNFLTWVLTFFSCHFDSGMTNSLKKIIVEMWFPKSWLGTRLTCVQVEQIKTSPRRARVGMWPRKLGQNLTTSVRQNLATRLRKSLRLPFLPTTKWKILVPSVIFCEAGNNVLNT